jgi:hypothetical protein
MLFWCEVSGGSHLWNLKEKVHLKKTQGVFLTSHTQHTGSVHLFESSAEGDVALEL